MAVPLFTPRPVPVPGMPGESVDARILADVRALLDKFKLKLTDGYATSGHAAAGDHPKGFGIDVVPDTARGGTWDDVDAAVRFAAGKPDTFRWIGYDGVANHGRGHHAHLSWHGAGTDGDTKPVKLFSSGDGGNVFTDAAGAVGGAVTGAAGTVAGAVGGVAGDVAGATANALLDLVVGQLGDKGARIALTGTLVLAGLALVGIGAARALGLGAKGKQAGSAAAAGAELFLTKGAGKAAGAKT